MGGSWLLLILFQVLASYKCEGEGEGEREGEGEGEGEGESGTSSHYKSKGRKPSLEDYFHGWFLATPDFIPGASFLQM